MFHTCKDGIHVVRGDGGKIIIISILNNLICASRTKQAAVHRKFQIKLSPPPASWSADPRSGVRELQNNQRKLNEQPG